MTKSRQQTARKPATKFAQLQKKLQKQKVHANKSKRAPKKGGKSKP